MFPLCVQGRGTLMEMEMERWWGGSFADLASPEASQDRISARRRLCPRLNYPRCTQGSASLTITVLHIQTPLILLPFLRRKPLFFSLNRRSRLVRVSHGCGAQTGCSDSPDLAAGDNELIVRENIYSQFKINWDAFGGPPLEL